MLRLATVMAAAGLLVALGVPTQATPPAQPATPAQSSGLTVLDRLQDGLWELRFRDGSASRRLCLHDRWTVIQLQHPDLACDRLVLENGLNVGLVQYTCRGKGYGRTTIRRETAQLFQVETQGVAGGLPYELTGEGRRIGDCPGAADLARRVASSRRGD